MSQKNFKHLKHYEKASRILNVNIMSVLGGLIKDFETSLVAKGVLTLLGYTCKILEIDKR
jgi:hypothetical protein